MPPRFAFRRSNAVALASHKEHTGGKPHTYMRPSPPCLHVHRETFFPPITTGNPASYAGKDQMGQVIAKAKQEAGRATQKTTDKDGNVVAKPNDAKELIDFMGKHYDSTVKPAKTFDEFYHAIFELIEMFCEEQGQLQYKMPSKKILEDAYKAVHPRDGADLSKNDFIKITESIITVGSFTFGKAAFDVLVVLFGAPMCALLVKRVVPGLKSFSDDVVIPVATSGAAVYLAKANKL